MKKNIVKGAALVLSMALLIGFPVKASAEEVTEARVPVTLTVITTEKPISVTVPAALPVSVVDGDVLVANNAKKGAVQVTAVAVESGALTVAEYDGFKGDEKTIALSINGIGTEGPGDLDISDTAFPNIEASSALDIRYQAKVAVSEDVKDMSAATVIFTIASVD